MANVFETRDIDAHRPGSPRRGHLYFSVDTGEIRFAFTAGAWTLIYPGVAPPSPADVAPPQIDAGDAGVIGASSDYAREDHQHAVNTGLVGDIASIGTKAAGTSAKLARADHVHDIPVTEVSDTVDDSVSTTTYTLVDSMTVTPAAGTYLVHFSASAECSIVTDVGFFALFKAGTIVQHTEREQDSIGAGDSFNVHTQARLTVNGSEAVEVRAKNTDLLNTMTIHERSMHLIRVA